MRIWKPVFVILFCAWSSLAFTQASPSVSVKVRSEQKQWLVGATTELLTETDSTLRKIQLTDSAGMASFADLPAGSYLLRISYLGFQTHITAPFVLSAHNQLELPAVTLRPAGSTLYSVTVSARRPFIETKPGKTIVNMDATISNAGTSVLEALEKLPGVTVDREGNISLKGKSGVTLLIDGKQTFLNATQLSSLLAGMNTSQLSQVEIMSQPSSDYDAAGNAGTINLKLKKSDQRGFNGSLSLTGAQGYYPRTNDNLQLNYRSGAVNWFLAYSVNRSQNFTRIEALRTYFKPDGQHIASRLEQPSFLKNDAFTHTLRTGLDLSLSLKTTAGIALSGLSLWRENDGNNKARWLDANGNTDSLIETRNHIRNTWTNGGVSLNFRHSFTADRELSADGDLIGYRIGGNQLFQNNGVLPHTYTEVNKAGIPSTIHIFSAKADYTDQRPAWKLKAGAKVSRIRTDNLAAYAYLDNGAWKDDLGKSNHFLYNEAIQALYANAETRLRRWNLQGGLRYEMTHYEAEQLGNALVKDSSFSRSYSNLFPTVFISYELDSSHTFSLSSGRRIDRPPFQKLNPFVFIINKYTYEQGNPFYRPQYTWNLELSHQYKTLLVTSLSYSVAQDFFSQIFPVSSNGIVTYTEGNLRRLQMLGASVSLQLSPAAWWSVNLQGNVVRKKMEGFIDREYRETATQGSLNLNNQLHWPNGWGAELSGFYTSRGRNDIQEVVDPAGQVSVGLSKTLWAGKGNLRLSGRDLFYTQWMRGLTQFRLSNEQFNLTRDTRMLVLSFSYRFGKLLKAARHSLGAAHDEVERVGTGQ